MKDDFKRKNFETRSLIYLQDLETIASWLTRDYEDSACLISQTLNRAYKVWHPCISELNLKMLLFKILVKLFFAGEQRKSNSLITKYKIDHGIGIPHNRLLPIDGEYGIDAQRVIVRTPVEIRFVEILSKVGGFSNLEIAKIIGIKENSFETGSFRGSRFINSHFFVYGEG